VGCGRIARTHARYVRAVPGAQIVAVCDPIENAAAAFAAELGIGGRYSDLKLMLSEARPDAVHVLTPPATHAEVAISVLEAGAHVLVEKPMALNRAQAESMAAAARRTGRTLVVDHNRWFDPVMQKARDLVTSGDLGELVGIEAFQGAAVDESQASSAVARGDWRGGLPGGAMHDLAPHPAYLIRNFVGPISDVQVCSQRRDGQLQEVRAVVAGERCLGTLTISLRGRPFANGVRIIGTRKTVEVNLNNMTLITRQDRKVPKVVGKVLPNLEEAAQLVAATITNTVAFVTGKQRYFPGMGILIEQFYHHLSAGGPPPTTPEEGVDVVGLLDALWAQTADEQRQRAQA
jgi:predicted dehydrogenase